MNWRERSRGETPLTKGEGGRTDTEGRGANPPTEGVIVRPANLGRGGAWDSKPQSSGGEGGEPTSKERRRRRGRTRTERKEEGAPRGRSVKHNRQKIEKFGKPYKSARNPRKKWKQQQRRTEENNEIIGRNSAAALGRAPSLSDTPLRAHPVFLLFTTEPWRACLRKSATRVSRINFCDADSLQFWRG